jgi:hypothetical protein
MVRDSLHSTAPGPARGLDAMRLALDRSRCYCPDPQRNVRSEIHSWCVEDPRFPSDSAEGRKKRTTPASPGRQASATCGGWTCSPPMLPRSHDVAQTGTWTRGIQSYSYWEASRCRRPAGSSIAPEEDAVKKRDARKVEARSPVQLRAAERRAARRQRRAKRQRREWRSGAEPRRGLRAHREEPQGKR